MEGQQQQPMDGQVQNQQRPPMVQLTPEELRVLNECSRESFWYRSAPISILFMGLTRMAVQAGYLVPHPKYGASLKALGAGLLGYIIGKVSYQEKCKQKIMELQNSPLADAMRRGKRGTAVMRDLERGRSELTSEFERDPFPPSLLPPPRTSHLDMDTDREVAKGLDDCNRPSTDSYHKRLEDQPKRNFISYDDLRQRNRAEFQQRVNAPPSSSRGGPQPGQYSKGTGDQAFGTSRGIGEQTFGTSDSMTPTKVVKRNKWGDIMDE